ncbi:MAG TPA: tetratricopeptide repeat protein [Chitinivibrionales bacterium]|nr:tetratricopeptide repeat protein [Chitinivibrionales bacterium]
MNQSTRSKRPLTAGIIVAAAVVLIAALVFLPRLVPHRDELCTSIIVEYPYEGSLFPADIVAPTFKWRDINLNVGFWKITMEFQDGGRPLSYRADAKQWRPSKEAWETIKKRSMEKKASVMIRGFSDERPRTIVSEGTFEFGTSKDAVAAPIFYREVNLPFEEAVKDPTNIQWRFGSASSDDPPRVVLRKLPVCGNCHSFSKDGATIGLEVDSGNDKGAYAVMPVAQDILLDRTKIISWASYKKEEKDPTFGLLCQVSPDGRYVAGTVKDQALAVYRPDLMFSQLFFLIKGIIAIYDRQTKTFTALPGADDRRFVQTNATWSPDGNYLVYPRSKAYDIEAIRKLHTALVGGPLAESFIAHDGSSYKYDLYRIPFNGGRGGAPQPLAGASNNGMSNYFAKYSPDGKWIVFCKAANYMLLQPDSKLYIMPAQGGEARELACNTARMNSWHSFSPNGRWLVFSSKVNGPYTQLFLAHIDENGNSAPPVVLDHFTGDDRAANIPEFVNNDPGALVKIREDYLDAYSYYRIANIFHQCGDFDRAIPAYRLALKYNPKDYHAHNNLGALLYGKGMREEAAREFNAAIDLHIDDADHYEAHTNLGLYYLEIGRCDQGLRELKTAYKLHPDSVTMSNVEKAAHRVKEIKRQTALQYQ